ncbi:MAG: signal recognition particle-docking protein FtsY [Sodalis sp. (in: enterobacteria)]|uniref:signal recognition particle-docking protein FtsY n=1 Tax=Sodalis sp. (in: enterobacteria) TaxID=1898979 RepID=UPI0039E2796D
MAKEKKRGFLSWLGFNRQDDDAGSEPEAGRETDATGAGGGTDAPVASTAAREEALSHTEAETAAFEQTSTPDAEAGVPVADAPARERDAQRIAAEIVSLTEQMATWRSHAVASDKTPMAAAFAAAPDENDADAVAPPSEDDAAPSEDDAIASSIVIADAAALTLAADVTPDEETVPRPAEDGVPPAPERAGFFARLKNSLVKTQQNLGSGFIGLFRGKKIDDDLFEELEEQLLVADVGVETTRKIIEGLTAHVERRHLKDAEALYSQLRVDMAAILANVERPLEMTGKTPFVILMVGVNGVGKTTTIGKLARQYQAEGKSVMLAAGDTFRAAAVEQLQVWGERNRIPVVAQQTGADSASVIFDAIQAAKASGIDVLIADTAGRLQNKAHLMDELKKIVRVMKKLDVEAPHEVMLTLDASTGQNAVSQANLFNDAVGLTGITLTKLDGTAKGGVIFAVADRFGIPIRYIGVGEGIEDLRPFKADDFIEALFARED